LHFFENVFLGFSTLVTIFGLKGVGVVACIKARKQIILFYQLEQGWLMRLESQLDVFKQIANQLYL
jgi:hypothetical protein